MGHASQFVTLNLFIMQNFDSQNSYSKRNTKSKNKLSISQKRLIEDNNLKLMLMNSIRVIDPKIDYTSLITDFLTLFLLWRNSEGLVSAVKRLKLNHQALLNFINKSKIVIPFIRLEPDGFPKGLIMFRALVRTRKIKDLRIINTLCRFHRNFKGDGKTIDLTSITDVSKTPFSLKLSEEIRQMCKKLIGNRILKQIKIESLQPKFFISGKGGPSGPALLRAQGCLSAMKNGDTNDQRLLGHLLRLSKIMNFNEIDETLSVTKDAISPREYHSRLRCKQDRSTKNRMFATVDYLTQVLLKPLNDKLFAELDGFGDSDATFNQNKIVQFAKEHSSIATNPSERLFSIDLSKATDRLKREYYQVILEELTGSKEFAESVILSMTDREFFYEGSKYKYSEGQGMGTYCSWPLMALLHHILVQISAQRAGLFKYKGKSSIYKDYILLGDDLALKGWLVYENYELVMNEVEENLLNKTKSIVNCKGSINMIEFASRFFLRGREITGVSTNLVGDLSRPSRDGPLVPLINVARDISYKLTDNKDDLVTIISQLQGIHKVYTSTLEKYSIFFRAVIVVPSSKRSDAIYHESFTKLMNLFIVCKMYRSLNDNADDANKKIVRIVYLPPTEKDLYDCPRDEDGELLDDSILGKALSEYQIGKTRKMRGWLDKQFIKSLGVKLDDTEANASISTESVLKDTFDPMGEFDTLSNYISMNLTRKETAKLKYRRLKMIAITLSQFQKAMRLWKLTSYRSELVVISGSKEQMLVNTLVFPPWEKNSSDPNSDHTPLLEVRERSDIILKDHMSLDVILPTIYNKVLTSERKEGWLVPVEQEITAPLRKGESPLAILLDLNYPQCGYESGVRNARDKRKTLSQAKLVESLSKLSKKDLDKIINSIPRD